MSDSGCWEWQQFRCGKGYGRISVKHRMVNAHIVALVIQRGYLWPPTVQVDHLCRNRCCCNPQHLELVTPAENSRRGLSGVASAERARSITHCPQGHEYTPENTYINKTKYGRICRRCRADGERRAVRDGRRSKRASR